jgi:hypothetical protein
LESKVPCASATVVVKVRALVPETVHDVMGEPVHVVPFGGVIVIAPGVASRVIERLFVLPAAIVNVFCCEASMLRLAFAPS